VIETYQAEGFVCFTDEDAAALYRYILELEAGYDQ